MMLFVVVVGGKKKSCAMTPSGGSQVDIADVCRGGGLVQLVETFSTGTPLCLLLLLLLLSALTQAADQHALDLFLTLFKNILQRKKKKKNKEMISLQKSLD